MVIKKKRQKLFLTCSNCIPLLYLFFSFFFSFSFPGVSSLFSWLIKTLWLQSYTARPFKFHWFDCVKSSLTVYRIFAAKCTAEGGKLKGLQLKLNFRVPEGIWWHDQIDGIYTLRSIKSFLLYYLKGRVDLKLHKQGLYFHAFLLKKKLNILQTQSVWKGLRISPHEVDVSKQCPLKKKNTGISNYHQEIIAQVAQLCKWCHDGRLK